MRRSAALLAAVCLLAGAACGKEEEKKVEDPSKAAESSPASGAEPGTNLDGEESAEKPAASAALALDPAALTQKVGVEPGPIEYEANEGAAAVVASLKGKAEVRRVGTETWEGTKAEAPLREGDQIRAAEGGQVTVTLVDETSIELAEESAIAIGSRKATEDPASSASVLYGVARFTVAARASGEGPFLVFTSGAVVATKGTVYTVGVAASGATRVGVESGDVEVAGGAKLDAPIEVNAGHAVVVTPDRRPGELEVLEDGDWGTWRDGAEADLEPKAAARFHAQRAEALEAELEAAYAELEAQTAAAAEAEAEVEAAEQANDPAAYEAAAPAMGGAVDASFALSLRLQYLAGAMLAHAYVADALYVRHPEAVAVIEPARPRLAAAVLWHKKYHAVADLHVEPLRAHYYVHHPIGRARARLVAYPVPPFYARVKLGYRVPAVSSRVKMAIYEPPPVRLGVRVKRRVHIRAPSVGWYAGVKTRVRPAPARVRWYVKPRAPRARVVFGAPPRAAVKVKTVFHAAPPRPRAKAVVRFGAGVKVRDQRSRVDVRDHRGEAGARVGGKVRAGAPTPPRAEVRDHRGEAGAGGEAGARVRAGIKIRGGGGRQTPEVRDHRVRGGGRQTPDVRDHRMRGGGAIRGGAGDASAGARARVKIKAPNVKPPKVKAKASVKVKGGVKSRD